MICNDEERTETGDLADKCSPRDEGDPRKERKKNLLCPLRIIQGPESRRFPPAAPHADEAKKKEKARVVLISAWDPLTKTLPRAGEKKRFLRQVLHCVEGVFIHEYGIEQKEFEES